MNLTEKVAYIRGLAEGLSLGSDTKETKVLAALIDLVDDMAFSVSELENHVDEISDQLDDVDEDLYTLENEFAECCDCDCECDDDDDEEIDGDIYEVDCAKCGETIYLDDSILEEGSIKCPNCGELLEFEIDEEHEVTE